MSTIPNDKSTIAGNVNPHPGEWLMQFFKWDHLPPHLQDVSSRFAAVADYIVTELPPNPERTVALRKLLEAKDCAVRARLAAPKAPEAP